MNEFQKHYNNEPPHYKMQYGEVINNKGRYNGIIIGNSQATHSIRPSLLNASDANFCNLAMNGSNPEFYFKWYNNLFAWNNSKVDYWIISADIRFLNGGWRRFEQDSEFFPFVDFWRMLWGEGSLKKKLLIANRMPILKYRARIFQSFNKNAESFEFDASDYDRGYITLSENTLADFSSRANYFEKMVSSDAKIKFVELVDMLSSKGSKIIFVLPPEYNLDSSQYVSRKEFLVSLSRGRNISMYDFNEKQYKHILNQRDNFVDRIHLSKKGSKVFSSLLKEKIGH
jgi:hypothetical protein